MSDETPVEVIIDDNLDNFTEVFLGQGNFEEAPASATEDETDDADALEPNDTPAEEDDASGESEEVEEAPPEPKLTPTQKRINEVVGKQRAAERALEAETAARRALEAQIADLLAKNEQAKPTPAEPEDNGPTPLDKLEDGTDKYPLGDFDPDYISDLIKFRLEKERAAYAAEEARRSQAKEAETKQAALAANWEEKVGPAKERYPDFDEAGQALVAQFSDLDPAYGNYLSETLMEMEFGPDVLYYLAQNPDEAAEIVASGARKATIALGRLETKFAAAKAERVIAKPRVSAAPTPPPQNKGSNPAVIEVSDDTDDLDAFTAKMFKKR